MTAKTENRKPTADGNGGSDVTAKRQEVRQELGLKRMRKEMTEVTSSGKMTELGWNWNGRWTDR